MRHIFAAAFILLAAAFTLHVAAKPAAAQTIRWDANGADPPNGIFSAANNWNPNQVPVVGNTALFDLKKDYSVTFLANAVSDAVQVLQGDVSFPGDPAILRTYNLLTGDADLIVRGGTLTVGAAGAALDLNVGDQLFIGDSVASGTVIVSGSGSRLDATGGSNHTIGSIGFTGTLTYQSSAQGTINATVNLGATGIGTRGNLNVFSGADLTTAGLTLGTTNPAVGNVTVDGSGSTLTQSGAIVLTVGSSSGGAGTVNVSNGGIFTTGTHPINVNATGTMNVGVVGGGTFNANGNVMVDGGTINRGSDINAFNLDTGLTLTASNNGQVNFDGDYTIDDGTTFDINSGAAFSTNATNGFLNIGTSGDGTLLVDGADSSVTTGTAISFWGGIGSTADVTFDNGASGDLGDIFLAADPIAGTTALFNVESGAMVTTDGLAVATNGGTTTTGTITVDGAGSSLTQNVGVLLFLGNAIDGTATINVTNGGTFSTGMNIVTLNATGNILIDGGTFNFNGPITNNGVSVNFLAGAINVVGNFTVGTAGILGGNPTLSPNKLLSVTGTTTIEAASTITLAGGALTTGILDTSPGGAFVWTGGNLTLTGAGPHTFASLAIPASATLATVAATTINGPVSGQPSSAITPAGDLTIGDASSFLGFNVDGSLTVGANAVTLESMGFANLGVLTTVAGGTLSAANGVSLGVGDNLSGNGSVNARIFADGGSTIAATGNLTLGDSSAFDGFSSDGVLDTDVHTVTLSDANEAVLGSLTSLGDGGGMAGMLAAANGLLIEFGKNLTGFGTVDTPDNAATPLINNGNITGNDPNQVITLSGYVKGVGTMDNVNITGTDAPGFSTAAVNRGSVSYNGTLEIEIGGTSPGSGYDQLNHILGAGIADLGGMLEVQLIGGFIPSLGDTFDILTAIGGRNGTFAAELLPDLGLLAMDVLYDTNTVTLAVVPALDGDFDVDGDVDGHDFLAWQRGESPNPLSQSDLADWEANYGMTAPLAAVSAAVPEPSTWISLLCGMMAILFRRDRARNAVTVVIAIRRWRPF